jgi:hypothetical protein
VYGRRVRRQYGERRTGGEVVHVEVAPGVRHILRRVRAVIGINRDSVYRNYRNNKFSREIAVGVPASCRLTTAPHKAGPRRTRKSAGRRTFDEEVVGRLPRKVTEAARDRIHTTTCTRKTRVARSNQILLTCFADAYILSRQLPPDLCRSPRLFSYFGARLTK